MNEGDKAQVAQRLAVQQAVSRVLLESNSLDEAMSEVLRLIATHLGWSLAVYWAADQPLGGPPTLSCRAVWADETVLRAPVVEATRTTTLRAGEDPPGQAMAAREPVWIEALSDEGASLRIRAARAAGLVSAAAFPLREREAVPAVVELFARDRRASDDGVLHLMTALGNQVALLRRRTEAQTAALEALERTRDELETILKALPDAISVHDNAGRVVYANQAPGEGSTLLADLQKTPVPELAARFQIWDEAGRVVAENDVPGARAARGESEDRQLRVRRIGGTADDVWIAVKATPVAAVANGSRRVVTVLRDVTAERRRREWDRALTEAGAALLAATELNAALEDLAAVLCRSVAVQCAVVLRHPTGDLRLAAFARADAPGAVPSDTARAEAIRLAGAAVGSGQPVLFQESARSVITGPLASRGTILGVLVLEASGDGRRYGPTDTTAVDELARRVGLAIENIRLRDQGQESAQAREDLMAIVSHDLRNPLGVVMASSTLLLKSPLADPPGKEGRSRRQVEAIQRAGTRMNRLIRDLLDFSAIQAGRLTISSHPRGVGELMREAFDALAPQADAKSLKLIDGSPESTLRVSCDHDRAIQLLDNVIGNAVKFSNEGGSVTVAAQVEGSMVRFSVTDEGPGITGGAAARLRPVLPGSAAESRRDRARFVDRPRHRGSARWTHLGREPGSRDRRGHELLFHPSGRPVITYT